MLVGVLSLSLSLSLNKGAIAVHMGKYVEIICTIFAPGNPLKYLHTILVLIFHAWLLLYFSYGSCSQSKISIRDCAGCVCVYVCLERSSRRGWGFGFVKGRNLWKGRRC